MKDDSRSTILAAAAAWKAREDLAALAVAGLRCLAIELQDFSLSNEAVPKEWFEKLKIAGDQIRRDNPLGQNKDGTVTGDLPPAKGKSFTGLKLVK